MRAPQTLTEIRWHSLQTATRAPRGGRRPGSQSRSGQPSRYRSAAWLLFLVHVILGILGPRFPWIHLDLRISRSKPLWPVEGTRGQRGGAGCRVVRWPGGLLSEEGSAGSSPRGPVRQLDRESPAGSPSSCRLGPLGQWSFPLFQEEPPAGTHVGGKPVTLALQGSSQRGGL